VPIKEQRIEKIKKELENPDVWGNEKGHQLSQELAELQREMSVLHELKIKMGDAKELETLMQGDDVKDMERQLVLVEKVLEKAELQVFLSGKYDRGNAIVTISAGAGGQDAQDWASMLERMYQRYAQKKGFLVKEISHSFGESGSEGREGTKQVVFEVQGPNAYGLLRRESGVHRLVRLSPFSAKQLRHTSFASLEVLPIIDRAKEKDIEISPDDIVLDTFKASGPGGQYVNKRETAIRITHIPTGIQVASQAQRSLQQNKDKALEMLAAKLYHRKQEEEEKELTALKGEKKSIEWGSQVRSYVLAPYQLVKDHRTNVETGNVQAVLQGELDLFIESEVRQKNDSI
jgi:peptide chain release factor 2